VDWDEFFKIAPTLVGRDVVIDGNDPYGIWSFRGPIKDITLDGDICIIDFQSMAISHRYAEDWVICNIVENAVNIGYAHVLEHNGIISISGTYIDKIKILPEGDNLSFDELERVIPEFFIRTSF